MGLEMVPAEAGPAVAAAAAAERPQEQQVVEIYPLSRYYFGAKDARPAVCETAADRAFRLKANSRAPDLRPWRPAGRAVRSPARSAPASQELLLPAPRRPSRPRRARYPKAETQAFQQVVGRRSKRGPRLADRGVHWDVVEIRLGDPSVPISASKRPCTQGMHQAVRRQAADVSPVHRAEETQAPGRASVPDS